MASWNYSSRLTSFICVVTGWCLIRYLNDTPTLFQNAKFWRKFRLLRYFIDIKSAILFLTFYMPLIPLRSLSYQLKIYLNINFFFLYNAFVLRLLKLLNKIFIVLITYTNLIFIYQFIFWSILILYFRTLFYGSLWLYEKIHSNLFRWNTFIQSPTHSLIILASQILKILRLKQTKISQTFRQNLISDLLSTQIDLSLKTFKYWCCLKTLSPHF